MSYYFLFPAAVFFMVVKGMWEALEGMVLSVSVTFFACYIIFVLFPAIGPRIYLENIYYLPFDGPILTRVVKGIVGRGGLYGGAMPSSHCAVALVAIWHLIKVYRNAAVPLVIVLMMLCLSTVYGRFHYISDVAAGLLLGAAAMAVTQRWHAWFVSQRVRESLLHHKKIEPALEAGVEL
jgi:membrane-associated phospholipid phosphatase